MADIDPGWGPGIMNRSPKVVDFESIRDEIVVDQIQENLDFLGRTFSLPLPLVAILLIGFAAGTDTIPIFEIEIPKDIVGNTVVIVLIFLIIQAFIATKLIKDIYTRSSEPEVIEFILKTHASIFNPYRDGFITGLTPIVAQGLVFALVICAAGTHYQWYGDSLNFSDLCHPATTNGVLIVNNVFEATIVSICQALDVPYDTPIAHEPVSIMLSALFLVVVLFYGFTFLIFALTLEHPIMPTRRVINGPVLATSKIVIFMVIVIGAFFPNTLMSLVLAPFT